MEYMFRWAIKFNWDISGWDTSNVQFMYYMFQGASKFNCDISSWDINKVINMDSMFDDADALEVIPNWYTR